MEPPGVDMMVVSDLFLSAKMGFELFERCICKK